MTCTWKRVLRCMTCTWKRVLRCIHCQRTGLVPCMNISTANQHNHLPLLMPSNTSLIHSRGKLTVAQRYTKSSNRNRNHKLEISTVPTKAKSLEPAYSHTLIQKKSIGSRSDPERQAGRQPKVDSTFSWEGRELGRRGWIMVGLVEEQ